jgi:hypothetical protein
MNPLVLIDSIIVWTPDSLKKRIFAENTISCAGMS